MFQSDIIPKYERNTGRFELVILESFINGISTRKMKRITEAFAEIGISHGTVSNIFRKIDINRRNFQARPLADKYKYILLDGLWCSVYQKWHFKRVVLVALGITEDGVQEIIDFRVAKSESEMYWTNFLDNLRKRGLTGEKLKLVIHDDAKGIRSAVNMVYPFAETQLCIHHKIMSIVKHIKNQKHKYELLKDCSKIYKQSSGKLILKQAKRFIRKWTDREPKVVKNFFRDFELTLNYLNYPKEDQVLIRTTSRLERANRYFRERTKNLGCFSGVKSLERFTYIVFFIYNERKLKKKKRKSPTPLKKKRKRRIQNKFTQFS
jgi:transposase-like protein